MCAHRRDLRSSPGLSQSGCSVCRQRWVLASQKAPKLAAFPCCLHLQQVTGPHPPEGSEEKKTRSKPQPWWHHSLSCAWKAKMLPTPQPQMLMCRAVPAALSHSCRDPDPAGSTWSAPTPPTTCQPSPTSLSRAGTRPSQGVTSPGWLS